MWRHRDRPCHTCAAVEARAVAGLARWRAGTPQAREQATAAGMKQLVAKQKQVAAEAIRRQRQQEVQG